MNSCTRRTPISRLARTGVLPYCLLSCEMLLNLSEKTLRHSLCSRTVPLKAVKGVTVSKHKDSVAVVHHENPGHDSVLVVSTNDNAGIYIYIYNMSWRLCVSDGVSVKP